MKFKIFLLAFLLGLRTQCLSQSNVYPKLDSIGAVSSIDSTNIKIEHIHAELTVYGKGQTLANKISAVSVIAVLGGTLVGIPAAPLLVFTSLCDLTTILISNKANKKLSNK
jgi:hypothetical protein